MSTQNISLPLIFLGVNLGCSPFLSLDHQDQPRSGELAYGLPKREDFSPTISLENTLQKEETESQEVRKLEEWEYPLNIGGSLALSLAWHEFGHFAVAHAFGFKEIEFHGPSISGRKFASVSWNYSFDRFNETVASAAGFGFTTMGNTALTAMLKYDLVPNYLRPFAATSSLAMMLDRHFYLWSAGIQHFAGMKVSESNDVQHIMDYNFTAKQMDLVYGAAMAASALELFLRRKELEYLVCTAVGEKAEIPQTIFDAEPTFYFVENGFVFGLKGEL